MSTTAETRSSGQAVTQRQVVTRLWDQAFNAGKLEVLPELVHEEFINFGRTCNGPDFLTDLITGQRSAFPDMRFEPLQTFVDGDWVITRVRWIGTFRGPFSFIGLDGIAPTGRHFDAESAHAFRFHGDKIAEHWAIRDDLTMHTQLLAGATK
jgi:predicted ester cyclase